MVFRLFYSLWLLNLATILRYWIIAIFDKADYIEIEPEVGLLTLKYPITDKHSDLHTSSHWKIDIKNIETPSLVEPKSLKLCVVTARIVCGYTCFTLQIVDYFLTLLQNLLIEFKWWSPIYLPPAVTDYDAKLLFTYWDIRTIHTVSDMLWASPFKASSLSTPHLSGVFGWVCLDFNVSKYGHSIFFKRMFTYVGFMRMQPNVAYTYMSYEVRCGV